MISRYDNFHGDEMYCRICDDECQCSMLAELKAEEQCDYERSSFEYFIETVQ